MDDIVERLRNVQWYEGSCEVRMEAAKEIERLREALQAFVTFHSGHVLPPELVNAMLLAREALE